MPRAALSQDEVDEFRDALCASATELFAQDGYEAVTMRALAKRLGCSPMTPYRYFENKTEIFDAVRSAAASRFADAIEQGGRSDKDLRQSLRAMAQAYMNFALAEPSAYRILFELDLGERDDRHDLESIRGWTIMRDRVEEAIDADVLRGDPDVVAHLYWSGIHGLVALHLSGMLVFGHSLEELVAAYCDREFGPVAGPAAEEPSSSSASSSVSPSAITQIK
ncbi:MAG: TetR/AcrR family transcriptional regulator [Myxococcota bacterium]